MCLLRGHGHQQAIWRLLSQTGIAGAFQRDRRSEIGRAGGVGPALDDLDRDVVVRKPGSIDALFDDLLLINIAPMPSVLWRAAECPLCTRGVPLERPDGQGRGCGRRSECSRAITDITGIAPAA